MIQDYITPENLTLARDLTHYLSPQISYLVSARPMAVGMGNAIRELKTNISVVSIDMPEQDVRLVPSDPLSSAKADELPSGQGPPM